MKLFPKTHLSFKKQKLKIKKKKKGDGLIQIIQRSSMYTNRSLRYTNNSEVIKVGQNNNLVSAVKTLHRFR